MAINISGNGDITGINSLNTDVSATELGYLDGTTSSLQTQISNKIESSSGSFTGTLQMNSNPSTTDPTSITHTLNSTGYYTKIGNVCTFNIYFNVTSYPNYVLFSITGLPFTASSNGSGQALSIANLRGVAFRYNSTVLTSFTLTAKVNQGGTSISLGGSGSSSSFSGYWYLYNDGSQGKYFSLNGSYITQ